MRAPLQSLVVLPPLGRSRSFRLRTAEGESHCTPPTTIDDQGSRDLPRRGSEASNTQVVRHRRLVLPIAEDWADSHRPTIAITSATERAVASRPSFEVGTATLDATPSHERSPFQRTAQPTGVFVLNMSFNVWQDNVQIQRARAVNQRITDRAPMRALRWNR